MSERLAVFILMNNYLHDIAIAMFLASGVVRRVLVKNAEGKKIGDIGKINPLKHNIRPYIFV